MASITNDPSHVLKFTDFFFSFKGMGQAMEEAIKVGEFFSQRQVFLGWRADSMTLKISIAKVEERERDVFDKTLKAAFPNIYDGWGEDV